VTIEFDYSRYTQQTAVVPLTDIHELELVISNEVYLKAQRTLSYVKFVEERLRLALSKPTTQDTLVEFIKVKCPSVTEDMIEEIVKGLIDYKILGLDEETDKFIYPTL
jgi:hypothetical protein